MRPPAERSNHRSGATRHERQRPPSEGRERGGHEQPARERDRERDEEGGTRPQAQSRQSILFLSASWLRCLTRKHLLQTNSVAWMGTTRVSTGSSRSSLVRATATSSSSSASSSSARASCLTRRSWIDSTSATAGSAGSTGSGGSAGTAASSRSASLGSRSSRSLPLGRLLFLDGFVRVFHAVLHVRPPPGRDRLDCARIVLPSSVDATEAGATTLAGGDPFPSGRVERRTRGDHRGTFVSGERDR